MIAREGRAGFGAGSGGSGAASGAAASGLGLSRLRQANAVVSALMLSLFLLHAVGNSFQLIGEGRPLSEGLSHVLLALVMAHVVIGALLTVCTLRAQRAAGVAYPGLNRRFWAVRISGLLIALLIGVHLLIFWRTSAGPVRLALFAEPQLVASVLLVLAIAVHALCSAEPLLIALGVREPRLRAADMALALALLLAFMVLAFVMYYLRWAVV